MGICVQQKLRTVESVGGEERRKAGELIWLCLGVGGGDVLQGWGELFVHFVSREKSEKQKDSEKNPGNVLYGNDEILSVLAVIKEDTKLKLDTCK